MADSSCISDEAQEVDVPVGKVEKVELEKTAPPPPSSPLLWIKKAVYASEVSDGRKRIDHYLSVAMFAPFGIVLRYFATIPVWKLSDTVLPNALGSFAMGFFVYSPWLSLNMPAIHTGLTTGLCGCFTTFSSWSVDSSAMFARGNAGLAFLSLAVGFVLSMASLFIGLIFRSDLEHTEAKLEKYHTYKPELGATAVVVEQIIFGSLLATTQSNRLRVLYVGALLAPYGACTRYALSKHHVGKKMPYFTLFANAVASFASALILRFSPSAKKSSVGVFLDGFSLGFNGGLSTVSTFVNEIRILSCSNKEYDLAIAYTLLSLTIAQILALVVLVPP